MDLRAVPSRILPRLRIEPTGCWVWIGSRHRTGYGMVVIQGRHRYVHRVVFEATRGPVPDGMELDHLCRVRACANPDHLEVVTHAENMRRSVGNNSLKTECPKGHPYSPENTTYSGGKRSCRTCGAERMRERRAAGIAHQESAEHSRERARIYRETHREEWRAYQREYQRQRRAKKRAAATE